MSSWILVGFVTAEPRQELHVFCFFFICLFFVWLPFPLEPEVNKVRDYILLISLTFLYSSVAGTQSLNKLINE